MLQKKKTIFFSTLLETTLRPMSSVCVANKNIFATKLTGWLQLYFLLTVHLSTLRYYKSDYYFLNSEFRLLLICAKYG